MFTHFDDAARLAMRLAQLEARRLGHAHLGTEHLLLGLMQLHDCVAVRVLRRIPRAPDCVSPFEEQLLAPDWVVPFVEQRLKSVPQEGGLDRPALTPGARKAIDFATGAAERLGHARVGTGHLLLGLLEEADGIAYRVLVEVGIVYLGKNLSYVGEHVVAEMEAGRATRPPPELPERSEVLSRSWPSRAKEEAGPTADPRPAPATTARRVASRWWWVILALALGMVVLLLQ